MSKDLRSTVYYVIDAAFNTKFQITKDELTKALEPPKIEWTVGTRPVISYASGGIILVP